MSATCRAGSHQDPQPPGDGWRGLHTAGGAGQPLVSRWKNQSDHRWFCYLLGRAESEVEGTVGFRVTGKVVVSAQTFGAFLIISWDVVVFLVLFLTLLMCLLRLALGMLRPV